MSQKLHERVHFRIFQMPCCHILICWVNPRIPNYCPECGARIFALLKHQTPEFQDLEAWLHYEDKNG